MKVSFIIAMVIPIDFMNICSCNSKLIRDLKILIFEYMVQMNSVL